jgi:hypothetical protein
MFYYIHALQETVTKSPYPPTEIDKELIRTGELLVIDGAEDKVYVNEVLIPITKAVLTEGYHHPYAEEEKDLRPEVLQDPEGEVRF